MRPLLLDMDGVLADFDRPLFWAYGPWLNCTPETQVHRFLTDHLVGDIGGGSTRSELRARMRADVEAPGWFRELPLIKGAQEAVGILESRRWDVWLCSKPLEASATCASEKFAWVAEHFPSLVGKLILAPNKGMVSGSVLVDDAIKPSWLTYANWAPVVYDHPWNRQGKYSLQDHRGLSGRITWEDFIRRPMFNLTSPTGSTS